MGCWDWVFQNIEVVIHVIRNRRAVGVVEEVMDGHRQTISVSDLYGAQQGHAEGWQVCLVHYADLRVMPNGVQKPTQDAVIAAPRSA